ncbi:MAG: hypothetical protein WC821_03785 [archaeon]|jgi:O-antigen ligase
MGNLFGDWFGDISVILFVFIAFLIFYYFIAKKGKTRNEAVLVSSLIIFLTSAFSVIDSTLLGNTFSGPVIGFYLLGVIAIISLIAFIAEINRLWERKK